MYIILSCRHDQIYYNTHTSSIQYAAYPLVHVRVKGLLACFAVACYMKRGSAATSEIYMYISSGGTGTGTLTWHYLVLAPVLYSHSVLLTLLKIADVDSQSGCGCNADSIIRPVV